MKCSGNRCEGFSKDLLNIVNFFAQLLHVSVCIYDIVEQVGSNILVSKKENKAATPAIMSTKSLVRRQEMLRKVDRSVRTSSHELWSKCCVHTGLDLVMVDLFYTRISCVTLDPKPYPGKL